MKLERIDGAVNSVLGRLGLKKEAKRMQVIAAWHDLVGEDLALRSAAVRVRNGVLWVEVSAPVWGQQIVLHKYELLSRIRSRFGQGLVKDIRTVLGTAPSGLLHRDKREKGRGQRIAVRADHQRRADVITSAVRDTALKERLKHMVAQGLARQEWNKERGWLSCKKCGALCPSLAKGSCFICRDTEQAHRVEKLKLLLMQVPWYSYSEASEEMKDLTREEYAAVKEVIAATWESAANRLKWSDPAQGSHVRRMLLMLKHGTRPENLPPVTTHTRNRKRGDRTQARDGANW